MLLALLLAGELFTGGLAPLDAGAPAAELSARACLPCHAAAHGEWAASRHGRAFTNAIFQREYRDQPLEWCVHCHAPLREQLAEVRAGGGPLADEGVGCASCHLRGGRVLAARQRPGSPHGPKCDRTSGAALLRRLPPVQLPPGRDPGWSQPRDRLLALPDAGHRGPARARRTRGDALPWLPRASPAGHAFPGGHDPACSGGR
jgi:hypothetical protein